MPSPTLPPEKAALVVQFKDYATAIAVDMAKTLQIETDDAISVAYQGLIDAAIKFSFERWEEGRASGLMSSVETNFKTMAYRRIRGAVYDEVRRMSFVRRRGHEKGIRFDMISLDKTRVDSDGYVSSGLELPFTEEFDTPILDAITTLDDRERIVMAGYVAGYTSKEIASRLKVTPSRVSQLRRRAKKKIEEALA